MRKSQQRTYCTASPMGLHITKIGGEAEDILVCSGDELMLRVESMEVNDGVEWSVVPGDIEDSRVFIWDRFSSK